MSLSVDQQIDSSSPDRAGRPLAVTPEERGWPARVYSSLLDVLGPDGHGPSSSHTMAPQLIALTAHADLGGTPDEAVIELFNSFAGTGEGHRTPIAVTAGLLGLATTHHGTPGAESAARDLGIGITFVKRYADAEHPNTIVIRARRGQVRVELKGVSLGGGTFEIVTRHTERPLAA